MLMSFSFRFLYFRFYKKGRNYKKRATDENGYSNNTSYHFSSNESAIY